MNHSQNRDSYALIDTLCQERGVLSALVVAQILALVVCLNQPSHTYFWQDLAQVSFFIILITAISLSCIYLIKPYISTKRVHLSPIIVFTVVVGVTLLSSMLVMHHNLFYIDSPMWFVLSNCFTAAAVAVLYIQFMQMHREGSRTKKALVQTKLDALQSRIRPHFLFNSLNIVAELTHQDAQAAEEAVLALASLSKAAMNAGQDSNLAEELTLAQRYIQLEQWRYGERLKVDWQLGDVQLPLSIPCLTIQPLLENAVHYSMQGCDGTSQINVQLVDSNKSVTVLVENTVSQKYSEHKGNGIALENIAHRLQLKFGASAQLHTRKHQGSFRGKLVIPKEQNLA